MYLIGQFSKIARLTVKTLHHYDTIDLLKPAKIGENNYRYYTEEQLHYCRKIEELKKLDFTLEEIKSILKGKVSLEEVITGQISKVRQQRDYYQSCLENGMVIMKNLLKERVNNMYRVNEKIIEPVNVISIRTQGSITNIGETIKQICVSMYKNNLSSAGYMFTRYYNEDFNPQDTDYEVCMPVVNDTKVIGLKTIELPGGNAISTIHTGPYNDIGQAYKVLFDYLNKTGKVCTGPPREVYLKGPDVCSSEEQYVTEIIFPCN